MALGQPTYRMANQLLDPGRLLGPAVRGGARSEAAAAPCCTKGRARQRWRPFRKSGTGQGGQGSEASACLLAIHPTGPPRQHLVAARKGGEGPGLARTRGVACLGGATCPGSSCRVSSSFRRATPGTQTRRDVWPKRHDHEARPTRARGHRQQRGRQRERRPHQLTDIVHNAVANCAPRPGKTMVHASPRFPILSGPLCC